MAKRTPREQQGQKNPAVEWRLALRQPIEAYDDYYDCTIEMTVGQADPADIKGLVVDFRYYSNREATRRSVLCWQCGRVGERIYLRGYCAFREELRTFRIDRMSDVIAWHNGQEFAVDDVHSFFAAFAANIAEADQDGWGLLRHND